MESQYENVTTLPDTPEKPLGWHKFMIYFALWAGALSNFITAFQLLTGSVYMGLADLTYTCFPGLHALDIVVGLASAGLGVFLILTRFALARFRRGAPTKLTICYLCSIVLTVIYTVAGSVLTDQPVMVANVLGGAVGTAVMLFINQRYYKNRAAMFVN